VASRDELRDERRALVARRNELSRQWADLDWQIKSNRDVLAAGGLDGFMRDTIRVDMENLLDALRSIRSEQASIKNRLGEIRRLLGDD
jgi:hypothetical protein